MALRSSSFALCALNLFISLLILLLEPNRVFGSSRGEHFGFIVDDNIGADAGLCASLVTVHGYKCQEFEVTTDDGYILSVQRITEGRVGGTDSNRQPVLLQHGVLADGATWVLNPPEQSLGMILVDNGFDVWISNSRGTRYSRRHVKLDPKDRNYWDWTWGDLVMYELPAVIDHIFTQTKQKIHYVGHSQGTLIALASFSEGRLIDKVKSAALLCPIAYLSHITTPLGNIAARSLLGEFMTFGLAEFNPRSKPVLEFVKLLCAAPGVDCYDLLTAITGKNCCLNSSTVQMSLEYEPQPTSTKNLVNLAQMVRIGKVSKYDYGKKSENVAHYGQAKPPEYNMSNIPRNLPLFLSYGGQDALSDVQDVQNLLEDLKFHDIDKLHVQFIKDYAHADFILGVNARDIVYNEIITFFRNSSLLKSV
ncbi:triacylglycerol lipase 2-like isoform X2 [Lycium barbarum]|uniref:triacylglycerol lipase 2-like isoform X2 n=1 Tax=Lycium barbarum TaxID=112863 RepID=UPI00293F747A|nr:triacylglycerol lipase 2-like isoform X2 [Lycium barbarum]